MGTLNACYLFMTIFLSYLRVVKKNEGTPSNKRTQFLNTVIPFLHPFHENILRECIQKCSLDNDGIL